MNLNNTTKQKKQFPLFCTIFIDLSTMPRGTPLYGQPAWWGEDEADEKGGCKPDSKREEKMHETAASGKSLFSLFSNSLGGFCCPVEFRVL